MKKKQRLRILNPAMTDSYSNLELYTVFENEVFARPKEMDIPMLRETLRHMDDRPDDEVAPDALLVWQRILRKIQEEKKEVSFGLSKHRFMVFVVAIILALCGIAYAIVSWHQSVEDVASREVSHGYYDQWDRNEKKELLTHLIETGIIDNDRKVQEALQSDNEDQITSIIVEWLGLPEDAVTFTAITERILGPFNTWSLEDKAWYSSVMIKTGHLGDEAIHLLPSDTELTQQQVLLIAKDYLIDHGLSSRDMLDSCAVDYDFIEKPDNEKLWILSFRPPCEDEPNGYSPIEEFILAINTEGTVVSDEYTGIPLPQNSDNVDDLENSNMDESFTMKEQETINENKTDSTSTIDTDTDIGEEAAKNIADQFLSKHFPEFSSLSFDQVKCHLHTEQEPDFKTPYYQFDYYVGDNPEYEIIIYAESGEILYSAGPDDGNG